MPLSQSLIVLMKRGKQNLLEYNLIYSSVSFDFFLPLLKINRVAVSFFVENGSQWLPTVYWSLFIIFLRVRYAVEDFKKSLSNLSFLIKFSYVPYTRKPFTWKVMLAVLSLFILFPACLCPPTLWSSFAFVCTYHTIFFISTYHKKRYVFTRAGESWHFRL